MTSSPVSRQVRSCLQSQWLIILGYFQPILGCFGVYVVLGYVQSILGYFGVWWPVVLGDLSFQVG